MTWKPLIDGWGQGGQISPNAPHGVGGKPLGWKGWDPWILKALESRQSKKAKPVLDAFSSPTGSREQTIL